MERPRNFTISQGAEDAFAHFELVDFGPQQDEYSWTSETYCLCEKCEPLSCCCHAGENSFIPLLFDSENRFVPIVYDIEYKEPVYICNPKCHCLASGTCGFSPSSASPHLELRKTKCKGFGLFAGPQMIPRGTWIGFYDGESIPSDQARDRLKHYDSKGEGHALLSIVQPDFEHGKQKRIQHIDATRRGSILRFMNHDCSGGNVVMVLFRYARLKVFSCIGCIASRDIQPGQELVCSYGEPNSLSNAPPCHCNSRECLGYLPKEHV